MFVPVISKDGEQLMPTTPTRAGMMIKSGDATPFWKNGIFCIRLNREPSGRYKQEVAVGIDPGSKKEGFSVKSEKHTYLNLQADAHVSTKKKIEKRKNLRRGRRYRKRPYRKNRTNRLANKNRIPPSTMARWSWKVRIVDFLRKLFPITACVVEDIQARTRKGKHAWNRSFSPLEVGKSWFYEQMEERFEFFDQLKGWETKELRDRYSLHKLEDKMSSDFHTHCVDAWVLATHAVGGSIVNNMSVFCIAPVPVQRRCLHRENPKKGGVRPRYGGTNCLGIKKGTLVKSIKHGLCWISGHQNGKINLTKRVEGKNKQIPQQKLDSFRVLKRLQFVMC